jgi:hypothetical protein
MHAIAGVGLREFSQQAFPECRGRYPVDDANAATAFFIPPDLDHLFGRVFDGVGQSQDLEEGQRSTSDQRFRLA